MQNESVLIIGAGLAGLSAAAKLHAAGLHTTVLEARERVGGRVYTLRGGFADGQAAEGGGEFIEDFHHRMIGLAQSFGLELLPLSGMESWDSWLAMDGKVGKSDDTALWGADLAVEIDRIWRAVADLGREVTDPEKPQTAAHAAELDNLSVENWLDGLNIHPLAKQAFRSRMRSEYTIEPHEMSLLDLARWASFYYDDTEEVRKTYRVKGGNDQIPMRMAAALPDVRTGCVVTSVRWGEDGVDVAYLGPDGSPLSLKASRAIIAVPFSALRQVRFEPPLPDELRQVVDGLTYGVVTKVVIQYRRRLSELGWAGRVLTDLPITCTWPSGEGLPGSHDLVTVYTGAAAGKDFTAMSDEERIREAIAQVDRVCPGSAGHVTAARTIAWANEPFTGGSYTAFKTGEVTRFWDLLRQGAGPLVFAGEHIAVHQGYMEGAVESGERAAAVLLGEAG